MALGVRDLGGYRLGARRSATNAYAIHVATHTSGHAATVKVSHADATSVLATQREAWALDRLRHPAIPELYATGLLDDGCWLATTPTGTATLARYRELPIDRATALIRDLCEILAFAHDRGIVVRALSPTSIVLGDPVNGHATIADWSDAELIGERSPCLDAHLDYLAPELARGGACSPRSDLYAIGAIAHRALAGIAPTSQRTVAIPLAESCPEAPLYVTALIDQLLAQDPEQRPQTAYNVYEIAAQMTADLAQLIRRPKWTPNYMDAALPNVEWDLPAHCRKPD